MTWVFVILTLVGIGITVRIVVEHLNESRDLKAGLQHIQNGVLDAQRKLEETKLSKEQAAQRVEEMDQALKQLQATANELFNKISQHRETQASRGKYRVSPEGAS